VEVPYLGKMVRRASPKAGDYVWVDAGGSVSAEVDLAQGYDFSQPGQYNIEFRSPHFSHTAKTSGDQAGSLDDLEMIWIASEPVEVTVEQ
jgi:peptidyl-Lys metalloendopeptidase